jgi:hypothetical protein
LFSLCEIIANITSICLLNKDNFILTKYNAGILIIGIKQMATINSSSVHIKDVNIDNDTKEALEKTLNNLSDDWIASSITEVFKSYSSKLITFHDILDEVDNILYGEQGGEATLAMLQSAEDFKKEFSNTYQSINCDVAS